MCTRPPLGVATLVIVRVPVIGPVGPAASCATRFGVLAHKRELLVATAPQQRSEACQRWWTATGCLCMHTSPALTSLAPLR